MPAFVKAEVGGIQNFIGSTGKLKEMIGGSEIVYHICQKEFYEDILREIGCARQAADRDDGSDWHMVLQNNAGTLCLLLPNQEKAKAFLKAYSRKGLEKFPGLPLFGAQADMAWDKESWKRARHDADAHISRKRMSSAVASGVPMLPVLRAARLDGLPAVAEEHRKDGGAELVSWLSLCKRNPAMLKMSEDRLRSLVETPDGVIWANDLEEMLGAKGGKVALIHMDGNDLGKLFSSKLEENAHVDLLDGIRAMKKLSEFIEKNNKEAFAHAAKSLLDYICFDNASNQVMPLRPLVMGGDDITVIARADIALAFIDLFVNRFESLGADEKLSLGVGMVVMDSSYPFAKAFTLVESLLENAKRRTLDMTPRPSSLDYLVLTEEVENNEQDLRARVYTATDGSLMTAKPLVLDKGTLASFVENGTDVLAALPRSALRQALTACRKGKNSAHTCWLNTRENLKRRLGGRNNVNLMTADSFDALFPQNFFQEKDGKVFTKLGDYLELERLLPETGELREKLLKIIKEGSQKDV